MLKVGGCEFHFMETLRGKDKARFIAGRGATSLPALGYVSGEGVHLTQVASHREDYSNEKATCET